MIHSLRSSLLVLAVTLTACVTINIYFPAAAAERAADRIIRDVWDLPAAPGTAPSSPSSGNAPVQSQEGKATGLSTVVGSIFDRVVTSAAAQDPDLMVSTPAIETLTAAMKARHAKLEPYYQSGAIGLTNDALVTIRDATAIPLPERNIVRQLVVEENADRSALYREIARANERPEWEEDIRATFASRWIANARSGWWYQDRNGTWRQK